MTVFYDKDKNVESMCFDSISSGHDLWDAMVLLWDPFEDEWGKDLKDGVEYYFKIGD
jgi:hypothetical protein